MNKFYLCNAIAYVNGKPHMGHVLEYIFADAIRRYHILKGEDVFYQNGTDEHGSKIYKTAKDQGLEIQEMVDKNNQTFVNVCKLLNVEYDVWIRTSSDHHKKGAQKLWSKLDEAGDIYKDSYEGLYCVGCEAYLNEKDLVDGKCPNHLKEPEKLKEENYFFKLSKYSDQIKDLIESDTLKIYPEGRRNEMLALCEEGLKDVSFSRPKKVLPWGVNVPDDDDQVMYVWCDALSNYITCLGYGSDDESNFEKYWPCDLQMIGKDILRFHGGIWIGMLLSAGIEIPKALGVHGFITSEGQKMSKSLGNVVDPSEIIEQYGLDALRFYLTREVPTGDDGDFSKERFAIVYSSDLANNYGNLVSRVLAMVNKYDVNIKSEFDVEGFNGVFEKYSEYVEGFDLKKAVEEVLRYLDTLNTLIEETKPWALMKEGNVEEATKVLSNLVEGVRRASIMLWPFIPGTVEKVFGYLNLESNISFADLESTIDDGHQVGTAEPLFPRVEV